MALKLHGYIDTNIMKVGRWNSLKILQYIHNHIAHLSKDISKKMSTHLPFVNVAAICKCRCELKTHKCYTMCSQ